MDKKKNREIDEGKVERGEMDDTDWQILSLKGELGCHGSRVGSGSMHRSRTLTNMPHIPVIQPVIGGRERGLMSGGGEALNEGIRQAY